MYIHFVGQNRDVMINMDHVKEVDFTLVMNIVTDVPDLVLKLPAVRYLMSYPVMKRVDGAEIPVGMFHFDFVFNTVEERDEHMLNVSRYIDGGGFATLMLPEIEVAAKG